MITPGRLWWLINRDFKRGFSATWHDYVTLPKIARWRCPDYSTTAKTVPVHLLMGEEQVLLTAWMLASWYIATQRNWHIYIHDDGTLSNQSIELLRTIFAEKLTIFRRTEIDAKIHALLARYPQCLEYRRFHPLALKIFDIPLLTQGERFLLLDSDLIFFRRPQEILDWVDSGSMECLFNEDMKEGSLISSEEARTTLNMTLIGRLNSGLGLVPHAMIDLAFCEFCFEKTALSKGFFWRIEQTLYALLASRYNNSRLLPPTYEVSSGKFAREGCICRHYVGGIRDRFYAEGVPAIASEIFSK